MAEPWTTAFGRYLRTLRERRGLSLDDVASLSEAFPDPIRKAYLSRCENGKQTVASAKLIALSRIYSVPTEVLAERMELDMEVDRLGVTYPEGLSLDAMVALGKQSHDAGLGWQCYSIARDSIVRAYRDPIRSNYRDRVEQVLVSFMNCGTAAFALGRLHFPLHEFTFVSTARGTGTRYSIIALERVSQCQRRFGQLSESRETADRAIKEARECDDPYALGYCLASRAQVSRDDGDPLEAATFHEQAFDCYRELGLQHECVTTLNNLADCYICINRTRAARRCVVESQRRSKQLKYHKARAIGLVLLGEIELAEGREDKAKNYFARAAAIAMTLENRLIAFQAGFRLFKLARVSGNRTDMRSRERELTRLQPWLSPGIPEVEEFRKLIGQTS